jgi:hypothetical protein
MLPSAANPSTGIEIIIPSPPRTNRATVRIRADFPPLGLVIRLRMNPPTEARNHPLDGFIYITVANIDESVRTCVELGGSIIRPPGDMGGAKVAIIRDPAGAVCALYEAAK